MTRHDKIDATTESSTPWNVTTLTLTDDTVKKPIQCHQYAPYSPTLIFTHGAGGTLSVEAVVNFCTGFCSTLPVLAFQGSMNLKARTQQFRACKAKLYNVHEGRRKSKAGDGMRERKHRVLLGGRSMGARAAVIAASEDLVEQDDERDEVRVWLVLVSYPLQGPKGDVRDQILLHLPKMASVLFVVGDEDAMCPLELLDETKSEMMATSQLVVVRGADHGMNVKPASMTKELEEEAGRVAARWVEDGLKEDVTYIGEERD
ncbi:hypothetical protein G6011_01167 [Alternaria panax]|uniref:KANL3/Tex30 alpha/beta hydrolase-like domain-containing protein n=1 Tax=Alternaria panax TaxID=48097 RepID=A0AAD4IJD8_9PLEO|nr:hypothetical protein G6011_01167 [Alternaria panax]